MRANEFLIENWIDANDPVAIAALLKHHCAPFLSHKMDKPFFRGVRQVAPSLMTQFNTPVGRKPKDLPRTAHEYCDEYFLRKFGHRYRSNAAFATGDRGTAATYGPPQIFIPIGEFSVCWSTDVEDLFSAVDVFTERIGKDYSYIRDDPTVLDELLQNYRVGDLSGAAYSANECMFACNSYFLLKYKMTGMEFDYPGFINTL